MSAAKSFATPFVGLADADEFEITGALKAKGVEAKAGEDVEHLHAPLLKGSKVKITATTMIRNATDSG